MTLELELIYQDNEIFAVNKPHGLLVHHSSIARNADTALLQQARDQLGKKVYIIHRLDRKTSGAILLALNKESQSYYNALFREGKVNKKYVAIVRGHTDDNGTIDYPIKNYKNKIKEAVSHYTTLKRWEIPVSSGKYATSRYSMVELEPETGRYHQLRMHLAHIRHPIIGDRPHGCSKQNRFWKSTYEMESMMLHATELNLKSFNNVDLLIKADYSAELNNVHDILDSFTI